MSLTVVKYALSGYGSSYPTNVCSGPDGNLWVADYYAGVWKVNTAGVATKYTLNTAATTAHNAVGVVVVTPGTPYDICVGPDGNLWVSDRTFSTGGVWKVTTAGVATHYNLGFRAYGICAGPDGNLWVCDYYDAAVWKVTTAGVGTKYSLPNVTAWIPGDGGAAYPHDICVGADGNLWAADAFSGVWVITTSGAYNFVPLVTSGSFAGIALGADHNIWVGQYQTAHTPGIWKVTPSLVATSYRPYVSGGDPAGMALGRDGDLWLSDGLSYAWAIKPSGVVSEYIALSGGGTPAGCCIGPDTNMWVCGTTGWLYVIGPISPSRLGWHVGAIGIGPS
jgi:virginiamycin B lyase